MLPRFARSIRRRGDFTRVLHPFAATSPFFCLFFRARKRRLRRIIGNRLCNTECPVKSHKRSEAKSEKRQIHTQVRTDKPRSLFATSSACLKCKASKNCTRAVVGDALSKCWQNEMWNNTRVLWTKKERLSSALRSGLTRGRFKFLFTRRWRSEKKRRGN